MNKDLEYWRKPKGWIEFWVGLIVLIFTAVFFGKIAYQENLVRQQDAKYYEQHIDKSD